MKCKCAVQEVNIYANQGARLLELRLCSSAADWRQGPVLCMHPPQHEVVVLHSFTTKGQPRLDNFIIISPIYRCNALPCIAERGVLGLYYIHAEIHMSWMMSVISKEPFHIAISIV